MAKRLKMTRARVSQVVALTFLAPDIQEQILNMRAINGREPVRERPIRPIALLPQWDRQRAAWGRLMAARGAQAERPTVNVHKRGKRA